MPDQDNRQDTPKPDSPHRPRQFPQRPEKPSDKAARERALDRTIEDSFPTSDPASSLPDPAEDIEE